MAEEKKERSTRPKINLAVDKPVFSWQSPEFVRKKRAAKSFAYLAIIAIILCVLLGFMHQWSGVVLVVVAAVVFVILSGTHPKNLTCALYKEGVVIDGKVYDFSQVKSFWLTSGELPMVKLQLAGRFAGQVNVPLGQEDPEQIRLFIAKHLPEEEGRGEDLADIINRIFRF